MSPVALTQTVKKGGCAAKVPAQLLREILAGVRFPPNIPGVTVDGALFDDAAIFQVSDELSLVQTLDFFTPIVDSPTDFGAIAAANALSDVYAMGGKPKTAMAILAAPLALLEPQVIQEVLQGACDVIAKAGASLVGGHSIDDDTLKFGLSVTGTVHPSRVWSNSQARPGDVLILTKPLGTGTLCAGVKEQEYQSSDIQDALDSMKRLNDILTPLGQDAEYIHAATDITGFGLAGHSVQMAQASSSEGAGKVSFEIQFGALPLFSKTRESLGRDNLTRAHRTNDEYTRHALRTSLSGTDRLVLFDPQTSGGLFLSVDAGVAKRLVERLSPHFPGAAIIGRVIERKDADVIVL